MRTSLLRLSLFLTIWLFCINHLVFAQQYPTLKVTFRNGLEITGKNGSIAKDSLTLAVDGQTKTYPLADVQYAMAKRNWANRWALGCGGCLAIGWMPGLLDNQKQIDAELVTIVIFSTALSSMIGFGIGELSDQWRIVYLAPN